MQTPTFDFPEGVYADVRFERVHNTEFSMRDGTPESSVRNTLSLIHI